MINSSALSMTSRSSNFLINKVKMIQDVHFHAYLFFPTREMGFIIWIKKVDSDSEFLDHHLPHATMSQSERFQGPKVLVLRRD